MADLELSEDPTSTWGATEEYKAAWNEKYGNTAESAPSAETPKSTEPLGDAPVGTPSGSSSFSR